MTKPYLFIKYNTIPYSNVSSNARETSSGKQFNSLLSSKEKLISNYIKAK